MANNSSKVKVVKRGGFGSFILGFFFGIIFFVAAIVGVGFYAYKNISLSTIEKTTGLDIPVKEEIKLQPLEKLLQTTIDLVSDQNSLTLKNVEETFGIVKGLTGNDIPVAIKKSTSGTSIVYVYNEEDIDETCLNISEFKTTPVSQLSSKLSSFINNLSLVDLQKVADFELPDIPLINNVKTLPLLDALNEISTAIDLANLTLSDLNTHFGVDLSNVTALKDFMNIPLNGEGTNNLAYAIQNATIANFTGLSQQANETNQAYAYRLQQHGVIGAISAFKVTELETALDNITLGKLLGYEKQYIRTGTEGNYAYTLETDEAYNLRLKNAGLLGALKDANLNNLQEKIEDLDIPNKKIAELAELGLVDLSGYSQEDVNRVKDITLMQIIDAYIQADKLI